MSQSNKKQILQSTIGTVVGAVMILVIKQYFFQPESFDKIMMKAASDLNESCPIMVDADTRLDNSTTLPDNIFQYNYTLVNYMVTELDLEILKSNLEPMLINNVTTNPDLDIFRKNRVTMAFNYRDKEGVFLTKILVTPEQYEIAN